MSTLYSVAAVAKLMGCSADTARNRMRTMDGVMNVGTVVVPYSPPKPRVTISADGRMARIDRRTGELKDRKKAR